MNKKNFCVDGKDYKIVIGSINYLEYTIQHRKSTVQLRKRIYKGFQVSNNIEDLYQVALKHIAWVLDKKVQDLLPKSKLHEYILNHKYRYKLRTYEQFKGVCDRYVTWCEKNKVVPHKITYEKARKFISEFAVGKQAGTIWNNQLVLKTIFNGLKKEKVIQDNVFADLPKVKKSPVSLMYFNSVQIKAIKEYCKAHNPQMLRAILLLYSCGIRPAELRTLQIYDVLFEDNLIEIRGKDAKGGKTKRVYLPDQVKSELTILQSFPPYWYVFGNKGLPAEKMISTNYLNDAHRKILLELKIIGRYALYSWKHTGAVAMVRAGINIKLIQQQLRHSSLDMTNEYLKNLGILDNDDLKNKMPGL